MATLSTVVQAPSLKKEETSNTNWLTSLGSFAIAHPVNTAKAVVAGAVGVQLYQWGVLDLVTRPLVSGAYFDVVPITLLSTAGLVGASYAGYNALKGAVGKVTKTVSDHPFLSVLSTYSLYQTGIASLATSTAWNVATIPTIRNALVIGASVDYAMNSLSEGKLIGSEWASSAAQIAKNPTQAAQTGIEKAQQKAQHTFDQAIKKTDDTINTIWNYSEGFSLLGCGAIATAVWLGAPTLAVASLIATTIPATFTYYKNQP